MRLVLYLTGGVLQSIIADDDVEVLVVEWTHNGGEELTTWEPELNLELVEEEFNRSDEHV